MNYNKIVEKMLQKADTQTGFCVEFAGLEVHINRQPNGLITCMIHDGLVTVMYHSKDLEFDIEPPWRGKMYLFTVRKGEHNYTQYILPPGVFRKMLIHLGMEEEAKEMRIE